MRRMLTRRSFLTHSAASVHLAAQPSKRRVGLALYTVRSVVMERPAEVLKLAANIGYSEVEIMRSQVALLTPHLKQLGLKAVSMHFETPLITGNWQAWKDAEMPPIEETYTFQKALDVATAGNIPNVVFNYLPPKERGELDYYRALSDKLNTAAEKCRAAGLRLWYHNHNFEFMPKPGGRPIDVLLERLDPTLIHLEVDLFWVSMAGLDPAAFVKQNSGRVVAVHLKDRAPNISVPRYDISSVPKDTYEEVGRGVLKFPEIFQATIAAGVKHYYIEQDHTTDPLQSIRRSYDAVRKLGL
ncbi:MAG TPA: sugar phosphate isomerase/epimerase [Bryobacteraceae bacterium]|nr:sugar phosphate isomerase/epimerase [Bryobacteraceae bacterium]